MPRPPTITDEQILEAARAVFLEKGVSATTAEVADRAGCAEGSIFKRFPTKADLFRAAMVPGVVDDVAWLKTLQTSIGQGDIRKTLTDAGLQAIDFFRTIMPLMMMSWSNPFVSGCMSPETAVTKAPALAALRRVAGYFDAEMRGGRLRRHDPEVVARVYIGSLVHYVFFELVHKALAELPLPAETYVRGIVQLIWTGVSPS
jgi:AcrR family transcriptional regulator